MYFYEVWVRSQRFHSRDGLIYSSPAVLDQGQIVTVPLKSERVIGVVVGQKTVPDFATKSIAEVLEVPCLPEATLSLVRWMAEYYPSPVGLMMQQFLPASLALKTPANTLQTERLHIASLPKLTDEQLVAYGKMKANNSYLLHGRTGSGKTRLYLELALDIIRQGRSVIVLTPEISLTTQLADQFAKVFHQQSVVLHSGLSPKERRERWLQILINPNPMVVIGARSAIFSPLKSVGLIVIDECHEPAYKQEHAPYYLTGRVAAQLRNIHNAKLVLGSATPLVSDYYLAERLHKPIIRLTGLARRNDQQSNTVIINSKDRSLFSRSNYLSDSLIGAIETAINQHEQAMLYLNRRGTARIIICEQCDWQAHCPNCHTPLTYHGDTHNLRCHICGYVTAVMSTCPQCHQPSIKYLSIGTKALEDEAKRLFRDAVIKRFDTDNRKDERLEQHYHDLRTGKIDIIVGTQLLAKGLDLPGLTVVGVVMADASLQLPDFTVNERTFELLSQVKGRVGRGHLAGQTIIQTYQPDNPVIRAAVEDNWDLFYQQELKERQQYLFPPFCYLLKITAQRTSPKSAEIALLRLIDQLPKGLIVEGPAPAFHERQKNRYSWQLVVKSSHRSQLLNIIHQLPSNGWSYDIDPINLI